LLAWDSGMWSANLGHVEVRVVAAGWSASSLCVTRPQPICSHAATSKNCGRTVLDDAMQPYGGINGHPKCVLLVLTNSEPSDGIRTAELCKRSRNNIISGSSAVQQIKSERMHVLTGSTRWRSSRRRRRYSSGRRCPATAAPAPSGRSRPARTRRLTTTSGEAAQGREVERRRAAFSRAVD
jgi:hypothetical protein